MHIYPRTYEVEEYDRTDSRFKRVRDALRPLEVHAKDEGEHLDPSDQHHKRTVSNDHVIVFVGLGTAVKRFDFRLVRTSGRVQEQV